VVTLASRDNLVAGRLADFDKILTCQLECGFNCFRSARDDIDAVQSTRRVCDQGVGQSFRGDAGEETSVGEFQCSQLRLDRADNFRITMTQTGYGGPTGSVQILLAVAVSDVHTSTADRDW